MTGIATLPTTLWQYRVLPYLELHEAAQAATAVATLRPLWWAAYASHADVRDLIQSSRASLERRRLFRRDAPLLRACLRVLSAAQLRSLNGSQCFLHYPVFALSELALLMLFLHPIWVWLRPVLCIEDPSFSSSSSSLSSSLLSSSSWWSLCSPANVFRFAHGLLFLLALPPSLALLLSREILRYVYLWHRAQACDLSDASMAALFARGWRLVEPSLEEEEDRPRIPEYLGHSRLLASWRTRPQLQTFDVEALRRPSTMVERLWASACRAAVRSSFRSLLLFLGLPAILVVWLLFWYVALQPVLLLFLLLAIEIMPPFDRLRRGRRRPKFVHASVTLIHLVLSCFATWLVHWQVLQRMLGWHVTFVLTLVAVYRTVLRNPQWRASVRDYCAFGDVVLIALFRPRSSCNCTGEPHGPAYTCRPVCYEHELGPSEMAAERVRRACLLPLPGVQWRILGPPVTETHTWCMCRMLPAPRGQQPLDVDADPTVPW